LGKKKRPGSDTYRALLSTLRKSARSEKEPKSKAVFDSPPEKKKRKRKRKKKKNTI